MINEFMYPSLLMEPIPTISATLLIDAANEEAAQIFSCPVSGTLTELHFCTNTVGTGATVIVALKDIDANGDPNTILGSNTLAIANTDDNKHLSVTLSPGVSVTQGQFLALTVKNPAASFGNMSIASSIPYSTGGTQFPYGNLFTASWTKNLRQMTAAVLIDGILYNIGCGLYVNSLGINLTNVSNPDEVGNIVKVPSISECVGLWVNIGTSVATNDFIVTLYAPDGTTPLVTITQDGDLKISTSNLPISFRFPGILLYPNNNYRVTLKGNSGNNVLINTFIVQASADLDISSAGQNVYKTSRAAAGAWTNQPTIRSSCGLILNAFRDIRAPILIE